MMSPGEVYFAEVDDSGLHPAIVVSREELNRGDYVVCILCTSASFEQRRHHPNCVPFFAGEFGFTKDCVARCDTVVTLRKSQCEIDQGPLGVLDDERLREIIRAIGYVIDADCEPT